MLTLTEKDMTKSKKHWHEGVFETLRALSAVVDYSMHVADGQRLAHKKGIIWPGAPGEQYAGAKTPVHVYRLYLQGDAYAHKIICDAEELGIQPAVLEARDMVTNITQDLFYNDPGALYLLCMNVTKTLQERHGGDSHAVLSLNVDDPQYQMYVLASNLRDRLLLLFPDIKKPFDEWQGLYAAMFEEA